ncbi:MAG TPA: hypothetical protein VGR34_06570 [Candidatus Dormibacteraeota bacterium]|nr:hypothetical protein [Candidatus Dormibacteraeota bacterium]
MTREKKILTAQIAGFVVGLAGLFIPGKEVFAVGFAVHFVGDAFFYFQLKRKGYI